MASEAELDTALVFGAVVLDTSVLYPMPLRDTLIWTGLKRLYRPRWSALIIEEPTRNLIADGRSTEEKARRMVALMAAAFPAASVAVPDHLVARMTNPPEDRHVLAAAVVANAEVIVTSNLRHFVGAALAPFGAEAWSPDAFLSAGGRLA